MQMSRTEIVDRFTRRMKGSKASRMDVLAQLNGCPVPQIAAILQEAGAIGIDADRARRMYEQGATDRECAKAFGVTKTVMMNWRRRLGICTARSNTRARSAIDEARARELYAAGASDYECAAEFGVSDTTMWIWRHEHGITSGHCRREMPEVKTQKDTQTYTIEMTRDQADEWYTAQIAKTLADIHARSADPPTSGLIAVLRERIEDAERMNAAREALGEANE